MSTPRPLPLGARFPGADRYAVSRWGITAVAVHDTRTGEVFRNDFADYPIRTASIIKASILLAFLDTMKRGDPAALTAAERADAEAMIRRSDNDATTRFWNKVGGLRVIDWIHRAAGTRRTVIAPENPGWWGYTRTTAADMATILARAATHSVVTPAACEYLLDEMRHVAPAQRWGIPDGSPDPARVAVKNGWYPEDDEKIWRVHSIGVAPAGNLPNRMVIAVLTRYPLAYGMPYGQETCRRIAAEVLRAF